MNLVPLSFLVFLNRAMSIKCRAPRNLPSATGKSEQSILFFIFHFLAKVKTGRKYHQNWDKNKCTNYLKKIFMPIAYLLKKSTWLEHILHGRPITASCRTKGEFKHLKNLTNSSIIKYFIWILNDLISKKHWHKIIVVYLTCFFHCHNQNFVYHKKSSMLILITYNEHWNEKTKNTKNDD